MGHYAAAEQLYRQALAVDSTSREATAELQVQSASCPSGPGAGPLACIICGMLIGQNMSCGASLRLSPQASNASR